MVEILRKFGVLRLSNDKPVIKPINRVGNFIEFDINDTNYISLVPLNPHADNVGECPVLILFKDGDTAVLGSTVDVDKITKLSIMHVSYNFNIVPYHIYLS